jgi:hypothetical protein
MILFLVTTYIVLVAVGIAFVATVESYYTGEIWCYPCCLKDEVKTREGIIGLKHWRVFHLPWVLCIWQGRLGGKHYDIHKIGKCPYSVYKRQTYGLHLRGRVG